MKKTIIAFAAVLATAFGASAVEYAHSLVINKTDGTKVKYQFKDTPVATFEGDCLKMRVIDSEESVLFPFAEVVNITIEKTGGSGVEGIEGVSGEIVFGLSHDLLEVSGLEPSSEVTVYDMSGVLLIRRAADAGGYAGVDISALGKGAYIVSAGNNSFKFVR